MPKSILITGASKGIGAATAERFFYADNDITDLILLARESEEFEKLIGRFADDNPHGKRVFPHFIDLADRARIVGLMRDVMAEAGKVDILINNAGYTAPCALQQISFADFERTMGVNVYAPFTIVQELLHCGNTFELIVNIASTAGMSGRPGWLTYGASKAAVINMSEAIKEELSIYGTRVVCISPGRCATDLRRKLAPDEDPSTIMQPEHVASVIDMLASDVGHLVDSQNFVVRR
ncbi:SDR family oxidoreductase [Glycomyces sp. A-F 0318]|uniref:SDR family NAD(P)-dependent oxidoreductase n=1 Tax=Glycomyces amatae TaxID=2881355 RepID=UPI001E52D63C|nr:SDR family oxidoreductase [Glycomyces amatae]MCD0445774.1 SDR family oxidoreductase [Glycomyces amatae]